MAEKRGLGDERTAVTVCSPNCYDQYCPLRATVRDGRLVEVGKAPFPDHPYMERICVKGLARVPWVYAEDRLREPLLRTGPRGSGRFRPIGWEEALDRVAQAMDRSLRERGPASLGLLGSFGSGGALSPWRRLADALGASVVLGGIDQGIPWADRALLGGGSDPPYEDLGQTRLMLLWGFNLLETAAGMSHFLADAQAAGTRVVAIDPRFTPTAAKADLWIPIEPGTDAALALAMIEVLLRRGLADMDYLAGHSAAPLLVREDTGRYLREADVVPNGADDVYMVRDLATGGVVPLGEAARPALEGRFACAGTVVRPSLEHLRDRARNYPPERAARITGVPAGTIEELAIACAGQRPVQIRPGYGVERWTNGDQSVMAIYTLAILLGDIGRRGGGIGRSAGGWPLRLGAWPPPAGDAPRPVTYLSPMDAMRRGSPVHVWLMQGNPLQQWFPDFGNTERVLGDPEQTDFVACADLFLTTSALYADVVLPAASLFEKYDLYALPFSCLGLQQPLIAPLHDSRSDLEIFGAIAGRLGAGAWFGQEPEEIIRQILAGGDQAVRSVSLERLRREGVVRCDVPEEPYVPHGDGCYPTATSRAQFYLEELAPFGTAVADYLAPELEATERFPLRLQSAHTRYRTHSTYANVPVLRAIAEGPLAELAPSDAAARGIADGDWVEVSTEAGRAVLQARVTPGERPGTVRIANGAWNREFGQGGLQHLSVRHRVPRQEAIFQERGEPFGWVFGSTAPFYEQPCQVRRWREEERDG